MSVPRKKSPREWRDEAKGHIRRLFEQEKVMHVGEIKVRLDGSVNQEVQFWQWVTYDALSEMYRDGELRRRPRVGLQKVEGEENTRRTDITFYYPSKYSYKDVVDVVRMKMDIINEYSAVSSEAGGYAETVIAEALVRAEFEVIDRNTKTFEGRTWEGVHDLDFVVNGRREGRSYGIQVKNTMTYPDWDDVASLIDICDCLRLVPWFVSRTLPGDYSYDVYESGGFYTLFNKWLLPEKYWELGKRMVEKLGQPVFLSGEEALRFLVGELGKVHRYAGH